MHWTSRDLMVLLFMCACGYALLASCAAQTARAHDALPTAAQPNGWAYPYSCCSGVDCREVSSGPNGLIHETPSGYQVGSTGEVIPYSDTRLKDSPDGAVHWCSVAGKADGKTICLFVPPKAF